MKPWLMYVTYPGTIKPTDSGHERDPRVEIYSSTGTSSTIRFSVGVEASSADEAVHVGLASMNGFARVVSLTPEPTEVTVKLATPLAE
jgi:hypothetical protein